jgi:transaldolase
MSYNQAIMAALAGANYVSLFWGRIRDTGSDAATVVRQVKQSFKEQACEAEIIVGSIRQMIDVNEALQAGADIVTVPPKFFPQMCSHPKTDEAVQQFISDFRNWASPPRAIEMAVQSPSGNGSTLREIAPDRGLPQQRP